MKPILFATAALAAAALALPASAQILGGQVGANVGVGVTPPSTAPVTGLVGQTVRGTTGVVRDTVRDTRDVLTAPVGVDARVQTGAAVSADRDDADLDVSAGAMVHASDGNMLGSLVRLTRDSAGRVESLVVRSADGTLRAVPATGASVQGDAVVTAWSSGEFSRAPVLR